MKNSTDIWQKEVHEDWFYHVPKMKALIIGSFPPPRKKWSMEFFYHFKFDLKGRKKILTGAY